jgi:hypothetical protein
MGVLTRKEHFRQRIKVMHLQTTVIPKAGNRQELGRGQKGFFPAAVRECITLPVDTWIPIL